ncbi:Aste57867_12668 [Aphanomyces stellatus]|uniref:Aste57867_12668 protein n=1 Tax=Aphanomyces stellatus TaxID=120398 RepID=A0A485KWZ6_9STRA|nr:hypothetical protein As57867_012622 [Aphanomyces stellatus]VFT89518.1 Aste57867_12668 [Aphanomyces stellatus]
MEHSRFRIESASSEREINNGYTETQTKQWVWCPDPTLVCVPGIIVATGKDNVLIVHTEDGEERQLDHDEAIPVAMDVAVSVSDVSDLTSTIPKRGDDRSSTNDRLRLRQEAQALEYSLLYTLRTRFRDECIYTECGASVLISVNPHRALPLYTPDQVEAYRHRQMLHEMPPHLFGLAENAKIALQESGQDQAIVLLGERGSGKSDAAKLILQYLCHQSHTSVSSRSKSRSNASDSMGPQSVSIHVPIEEQMLHACTVLEAFGHSMTAQQANGSSMVKIFSVDYDTAGRLLAGNLTTYSLEKIKVMNTTERNFHVFHYLLAEASVNPAFRDSLELNHTFENAAGPIVRSEAKQYQDVVASLTALRVPAHHVHNIMRVVAALLHLGSVKFVPASGNLNESHDAACMVLEGTAQHMQLAANLLEVEASVLDHYFRTRKMVSSNQQSSLKIVSVHQATRARDTFCKNLYESLVNAIVFRMNASLRSKLERYEKSNITVESRGIHVIDTYGFNSTDDVVQGFDTLCAHYWAEKMRAFYLSTVFSNVPNLDADVYTRLYEQSPVGIFPVLADQMTSRNRQAHDAHFVNKLLVANDSISNKLLQPVLPSNHNKKNYKLQFTVQHSNGNTTTYEADDVVRRNNKSVSTTAAAILKSSKNSFVKAMVDRHGNSPALPAPTVQGNVRVATNFNAIKQTQYSDNVTVELMQQTSAIIAALRAMGQHFVVCVNPQKDDQLFHSRDVVRQLRCVDILNLIVSCQRNLTVKLSPPLFFSRYRNICGHRQTLESLIRSLIAIGVMDDLTWRVEGVPPQAVLLHVQQRKKLEKARELYLNACATMIQRNLQRSAFRKLCLRRLTSLASLRIAMQSRNEGAIRSGLTDATSWMEDRGQAVRVVQEAKQIVSQLAEESYLTSILTEAMATHKSAVILKHAIATAQAICPSWKHPLLVDAHATLAQLATEPATASSGPVRQALLTNSLSTLHRLELPQNAEGALARDLLARAVDLQAAQDAFAKCFGGAASATTWSSAISKLLELGVVDETLGRLTKEWDAWAALRDLVPLSRLEIEGTLEKAVDTKCLPAVELCLNMLTEMGTNNDDLVLKGVALLDDKLPPVKDRPQAVAFVELAIQADSPLLLEAAMAKCRSVGMAQWDMNVRKVEKALEAHKKERTGLEDAWKALLAQDLAAVQSIQSAHPLIATSPCFGFVGLIQNHQRQLQRLSQLPLDQRVEAAAKAGLLHAFTTDLPSYFASIDQSHQVTGMQHTLRFIHARVSSGAEVRQDLLSLLTTQTQQILASDQHPPALLEEAGALTKRLQKSLMAKSKLQKILKAPTEAAVLKWLEEVADTSVEKASLQAAHDVLRQLKASHHVVEPQFEEDTDERVVDTSLNFVDYDQLRHAGFGGLLLQWESRVLDQPLLQNQRTPWSIHVNRCILGYMRDRVMWYREMLAQSILQLGLQHPSLVDEIFVQIMKQLTHNPKPESERRGWALLALCLSCFEPSPSFEKYVLSFVHQQKHPVAVYCQTRLDSPHVGHSGFLPSLDELQSFDLRAPFVASIELMDGTTLTTNFPVSPELTVTNVVEICAHFLGLQEPTAHLLGLAKDYDAPVYHPQAYLCDVFDDLRDASTPICSFVLKIRLCPLAPSADDDNPIFQRLVFLQAMEDILQGNLPLVQIEPVVRLATYAILADADVVPSTVDEVLAFNVIEYLPPAWQDDKPEDEYAQCVLAQIELLGDSVVRDKQMDDWQALYVDEVKKHRLYGCHFFDIHRADAKKPSVATADLFDSIDAAISIVGINGMGVHFLDASHNVVLSWEHSDVVGVVLQHNFVTMQTSLAHAHVFCERAVALSRLVEDYALFWHKSKRGGNAAWIVR